MNLECPSLHTSIINNISSRLYSEKKIQIRSPLTLIVKNLTFIDDNNILKLSQQKIIYRRTVFEVLLQNAINLNESKLTINGMFQHSHFLSNFTMRNKQLVSTKQYDMKYDIRCLRLMMPK